MARFQEWEKESWSWGKFRRMPSDFQAFVAIGILAPVSAVLLVAILTIQRAS